MGFLDRLFEGGKDKKDSFWESISTEDNIDEIMASSNEYPQVIFKHSNQCGTSFFAKKNLEIVDKSNYDQSDFYIIDVIRQRMLSSYLSVKVGVRHESPQLFVLKDGEVVWHGSHHQVNEDNLIAALNQALG